MKIGTPLKYLLMTFGIALAACAASFWAAYAMNDHPALRRAAREGDAMTWLRVEFHLSGSQFTAIKKLHEDYATTCAAHCVTINTAKQRNAPATEIAALEDTCVESMTAHFRQVAALMPANEGDRYLAMVLPRVKNYDHKSVPNVRVAP